MNVRAHLAIEVLDFEVIEIGEIEVADAEPGQRQKVRAAGAAESGDDDALGAQDLLLRKRDPADVAIESVAIGKHVAGVSLNANLHK